MDALRIDRARARRLRLGRPRRLHRRGAVAGARARPRHRQRLQHPGHRRRRTSRHAPEQERASGTSIIFTPSAAAPGSSRTAARLCRAALAAVVAALGISTTRRSRRSAASFDNPDFVAVTIQSYRHRYGNAPGDPALDADRAAALPRSRRSPCRRSRCRARPTACSGRQLSNSHARHFTGPLRAPRAAAHRAQPAAGSAGAFADAILALLNAG